MDFFLNDGIGEVKGLFSIDHLIFSIVGLLLVLLLVFLSRKLDEKSIKKVLRILFFTTLILEVLKIIWNLTIRTGVTFDQWIPLYFCSIFMYALGLAGFAKGKLERVGVGFLFYGGIVAGISFILYPASALPEHPLLHVLTFHSLIYHVLSVASGIVVVMRGYFKPRLKDFYGYFLFTLSFCIIAYIFNIITDSNLMFIMKAYDMAPLAIVEKIFGIFYPAMISLLQILGTFFISFGCYKLIMYNLQKKIDNNI